MKCECGFKKTCPNARLGDTIILNGFNGVCHLCGSEVHWGTIKTIYLGDEDNNQVRWHKHKILSEYMSCPSCGIPVPLLAVNCGLQNIGLILSANSRVGIK